MGVYIMMYIGIDVGLNGGIVIIDENQNLVRQCIMPTLKEKGKIVYDVNRIVNIFTHDGWSLWGKRKACLEKEHVRPISGKRASFNLGFGYGLMQGILEALDISYEIVKPQTWMKELEIDSKDKKGSILFCQRKWPKNDWTATERSKKVHDGLTDAAGIALYCYRINKQQ